MVSRTGSIFLKVLRLQRGKIAVPQEGTRFVRQSLYLYYSIPQQKKQALQQPFFWQTACPWHRSCRFASRRKHNLLKRGQYETI